MLQTYFDLMNANATSQVYHTAVDIGVMDALLKSKHSIESLATSLNLSARPLELLLKTLTSLQLVERSEEEYWASTLGRMLVTSEYRKLGNQYLAHLPAFLKTGLPIASMDKSATSEMHYVKQAQTLSWMLAASAQECASKYVQFAGRKPISILDLASGAAQWSLILAVANPESTVTAVDWPSVVQVASGNAQQLGLVDRFTAIPGNLFEVSLETNAYDVVVLANIIHLLTETENLELMRIASSCLKQTGRLLLVDVFDEGDQTSPSARLYEMGLALRTQQGHIYRPDEFANQFREVGLNWKVTWKLESPPNVLSVLVAEKQLAT